MYRKPARGRTDPNYQKKYMHQYYRRNKTQFLRNCKRRRSESQEIINIAKSVPCADCGESYPPYVMDFDHIRGKKEFQLGGKFGMALNRLLKEIDKCDVVCANCHRERTYARGQYRSAHLRAY